MLKRQRNHISNAAGCAQGRTLRFSSPSKSFVPRENLKTRGPPRPDGKWVEVVEIKVGEGKELVMDLWDEQDREPRTTLEAHLEVTDSGWSLSVNP